MTGRAATRAAAWAAAAVVLATCLTTACGPAAAASRRSYESRVVGLLVTYQSWDEDRPWAKKNPATRRAAGVVVEGPYILTTAQMVADATLIRVEISGRATRFTPRVLKVDREVDLALLTVDQPEFFDPLDPVRLVDQSPIDGDVRAVRWNNQQLESLVSRVKRAEVAESHFGELEHAYLLLQTDLTGGGWGEPLFEGDRLVGLISSQDDTRAWVIPAEIISAFLRGDRLPVFGVQWQVNEDPALARFLGQQGPPRGVIVREVPWGASGCGVLRPRDILLSIDGNAIEAEGYYAHPRLGQLRFTNLLVDGHRVGDTVPLQVLRDGELLDLEMTLRAYPAELQLIPARRGDVPPPYIIVGGLVLRELDGDYLRSWGAEWASNAPLHLVTRYFLDRERQTPARQRWVILTSVLPDPYNVGYQSQRDQLVTTVNGQAIDSIADVAAALDVPVDGFHILELERNSNRHQIVLDAAGLEAANARIFETYRIPQAARLPTQPMPDGGPPCDPGAR